MLPDHIEKISDFNHFSENQQQVFTVLNRLQIPQQTYRHPAIFTVEEGHAFDLSVHLPGQGGKSLLLTTKDNQLWLVVACEETRVNLKALSDRLGVKRFSFAKPDVMLDVMGVTPGSATPFALINDVQRKLNLVLDEAFLKAEKCVFHPLRNDHSTIIAVKDLLKFCDFQGYQVQILSLE